MNDCYADGVNEVALGKKCGLAPNDVALRANGIEPFALCAEIQLIFSQKYDIMYARKAVTHK